MKSAELELLAKAGAIEALTISPAAGGRNWQLEVTPRGGKTVTLMTQRKEPRTWASLDTLVNQLHAWGVDAPAGLVY